MDHGTHETELLPRCDTSDVTVVFSVQKCLFSKKVDLPKKYHSSYIHYLSCEKRGLKKFKCIYLNIQPARISDIL